MARKKPIRIHDTDVVDGGDIDLDAEEVYLADGTRLTEAPPKGGSTDAAARDSCEPWYARPAL